MSTPIDRLIAACGLRHFGYHPWPAPVIAASRPAAVAPAVMPAEVMELPAEAIPAPSQVTAVPAMALAEAPPAPPAEIPPSPVRHIAPVVVLPTALANPAPEPPRPAAPPLRLPPAARSPAPAPRTAAGGRPPVVLPPPEEGELLFAFRHATPRAAGDRRTGERRAPPVQLPHAEPSYRAGRRPVAGMAPPRRFALFDELNPPDAPRPSRGRTP